MRADDENCGCCDAFLMTDVDATGVCRAHAPRVLHLNRKGQTVTVFPRMKSEGWCREWKPDAKYIREKS